MIRVEGETVIGRPVEMMFDYVADQQNEPAYDPRMLRAEKITDGPAGKGTRFVSAAESLRRVTDMVIEITAYERPRRLGSTTAMSGADISGTLTFEPVVARLPCCMAPASGFQQKAATTNSSPTSVGTWHDQSGCSDCVGCGLCIIWCPAGLDTTEDVAALRAGPASGSGGAGADGDVLAMRTASGQVEER